MEGCRDSGHDRGANHADQQLAMVGVLFSNRAGCEATWQRQKRIGKEQQRRAAKFELGATAAARRATSRSGSGARIGERHERGRRGTERG